MSGEDQLLPVILEKLEIVSGKASASVTCGDENPFRRRSVGSRANLGLWRSRCNCSLSKKPVKNGVFKRNSGKLLKDPVLKYVNTCCQGVSRSEELSNSLSSVSLSPQASEPQMEASRVSGDLDAVPAQNDFRALVSSCSQLRISNMSDAEFSSDSFRVPREQWRESDRVNVFQSAGSGGGGWSGKSEGPRACSQQALNPPCDVTIDELASYFETLVHIPKKMSTMAEMMYI